MWILPLIATLALVQGPQARPYAEERQLLDRHLALLARALPDGATPDADALLVRDIAAEAGLRNVLVGAPTVTETGALGQSRRILNATSTYPDADRFFRALQASPRLVDVESVTLRPAEFGVSVETRLRFHHRSARAPAVATLDPARARDRTRGATREQAANFVRDEQLVLEKTILLDDLRRKHASPRMFLAETGASFRDASAALTLGSLDGDSGRFVLRGVAAGIGAADALERRLENGFFRIREFSRTRKDGCFEFEAVGESFRAGPEAALPLPVDEPFRPTDAYCRPDRDPGTASGLVRATGSDSSGLSFRAVDADVADVAAMIESLTREPFLVSEEVRGRVNVEFQGASIDDALKALPLTVDRAGSVRVLRPAGSQSLAIAEAEENAPTGRISLRAKRTRAEDLLAGIAEAEPAFVALGPAGLPKLSVFARETATPDLRRAVIALLSLEETREETARVLRFKDRASDPKPIVAGAPARIAFRSRDLAVEELALAGLGRAGSEFLAFVYSPLGEIVPLRAGDALADGVVAAVDAGALLIDTSEGPVRISLAASPRPR